MPNSTIPKISRRRRSSSSSHDGGDRTTTIVELLFSTNLIHLLFFPCRTEIVASRREILSPVFFLLRKQEETSFSLSEKKRKLRIRFASTDGFNPIAGLIRFFGRKEKRKRDRKDDDVCHSECATIFGRFAYLSSGRGMERESWKEKDGAGGRPGNRGFQVDAPLRSLANEGSTPCAVP